tara:strand:+ start:478 stop:708 length:231 start_codon:yes stop_codon:yes gene_type:complete
MTDSDTLVVLSTPTCHRCDFVGRHLDGRKREYTKVDVTEDAEWRSWMEERGFNAVPITIKGDGVVHGVDLDAIDAL